MALRLSMGLRNKLLGDGSGGSLKSLLADGVIEIYSGGQPATANTAESGTKLVRITSSGSAFTASSAANGLELGSAASGAITKDASESWTGTAVAAGTAGWFRYYSNAYTTGASSVGVRLDGNVGTSGTQLTLASTTIAASASVTVDSVSIGMPAS